MKRLIIICEGPTEHQFCMQVFYPHFMEKGIIIQCPYPKWSHGGHIAWPQLKKQITLTLQKEPDAFVTTFIDLYGLHKADEFPNWHAGLLHKANPYKRIAILEAGMAEAISGELRWRFIPNIILYEFEGLLFNDIKYFDDHFELDEYKDRNELIKVLKDYPNPELINDTKETSPSHRLDGTVFHTFKKTLNGIEIAKHIGLDRMRKKSRHFNEWITKLENILFTAPK